GKLYSAAAEKTGEKKAKEIFTMLADEEQKQPLHHVPFDEARRLFRVAFISEFGEVGSMNVWVLADLNASLLFPTAGGTMTAI
ncbi:MAG: hypothetical protein ACLFO1_02150, partial [Spirochaetaceae bacterium]